MLQLLQKAHECEISLWVEEGDIELAFGDAPPNEDFIETIRRDKDTLLSFLSAQNICSEEDFERYFEESATTVSPGGNTVEAIFPATSLQQGFVYHYLSQPEDDAYRVQLLLDYHHTLDIEKYIQAWKLVSRQYPILRASFDWDGEGEILQIISKKDSIDREKFQIIDLSDIGSEHIDEKIKEIQEEDRKEHFDLRKPGLIRFTIIKQNESLFTLIKTEHHSIADGWSGTLLLQSVHANYARLLDGKEPTFKLETAYLRAQKYYEEQKTTTEKYWTEVKLKLLSPNDISYLFNKALDLNALKTINNPGETCFTLSRELSESLRQHCQSLGVTMSVAVQFAWHKLLQIYTGDEQTIVGTTVSGRDIPIHEIEKSVGLYINTLPLIVNWPRDASIVELLDNIQATSGEINTYSNYSLARLQDAGERLFHSLFVFENYPISEGTLMSDEGGVTLRKSIEKLDYPLALMVFDNEEGLELHLKYDDLWLDRTKAQRIFSQLEMIIRQIIADPERSHNSIQIIDEHEKERVVSGFNQTSVDYPKKQSLVEVFEDQVDNTPDAVAVTYSDTSLTYREFEGKANQLANYLLDKGAGKGELVGVYAERSIELLLSIYAIQKAGAAYVPLDPSLPDNRIVDMLKDANPKFILTLDCLISGFEDIRSKLDNRELEYLSVDDQWRALESQYKTDRDFLKARLNYDQNDLAYVIYTSGSTGKPKGVMNQHSGILNRLYWMQDKYNIGPEDKILQKTPFGFDVSVWEIFWPLQVGATLVLAEPNEHKDPIRLWDTILQKKITVLHFVPSMLEVFLQHKALNASSTLRHIFCSGEALGSKVAKQCLQTFTRAKLHNLYGPTEAAIDVSYWECLAGNVDKSIPIGAPISNTSLFVLDSFLNPVPIGVRGEIYIGGTGLARGYLNRKELTKERFITSPFVTTEKLYKTGDLGYWREDGCIQFLGRNDFQLKIRGLRIELGEIENTISSYNTVKQVAVVDNKRDNSISLAAYLVPHSNIDVNDLRRFLAERLPDYMVPSTFTLLDKIPTNINGKLDRKALPVPIADSADSYVAGRNKTEIALCSIWEDTLKLNRVGIDDNFFRIGGNSITAIQLTAAIRNKLEIDIPLAVILEQKTVRGIAERYTSAEFIPQADCPEFPLSFAQERMLFIERFEQGSNAYHIPLFVQFTQIDELAIFENALNLVANKHHVLRTLYRQDKAGRQSQQIIDYCYKLQAEVYKSEAELQESVISDIMTPFSLENDVSLKVKVYQLKQNTFLLFLFHHISFDGWSTSVFLRDFAVAFRMVKGGEDIQLTQNAIRYVDFSVWQRKKLQGEFLEDELAYWRNQLAGFETLNIATDFPRPLNSELAGMNHHFEIDDELYKKLKKLARDQETTLYTITLSAFYLVLHTLSGQDDIVIGSPSDNRHHVQTHDIIGLFVNSLALRVNINKQYKLVEFIKVVHETVIAAKVHQELPFEKILEGLNVERDTSRHPVFQIMFSLEQDTSIEEIAPGLPIKSIQLDENTDVYTPAKFDLDLTLFEKEGKLKAVLNYAISLFNDSTAKRIGNMFDLALRELLSTLDKNVNEVNLVSEQERHILLSVFNNTDRDFRTDATFNKLIEEQAERQADSIALEHEGKYLSYGQLNSRANKLALDIQRHYEIVYGHSLAPGNLISVYISRSIDFVVSVLAILKVGAAYVPISPEYPGDRVEFILKDTSSPLIITQNTHTDYLGSLSDDQMGKRIILTVDAENKLPAGTGIKNYDTSRAVNNGSKSTPGDLAYVIYTSGTTGQPKGVQIDHKSIVDRYFAWRELYLSEHTKNFLQMADFGFDVATGDMARALCSGGRLVICPKDSLLDAGKLTEIISERNIHFAEFVPAVLRNLVDFIDKNKMSFSSLETLAVGSDKWTTQDHMYSQKVLGNSVKLYNTYGLTECTVDSTYSTLELDTNIDITRSVIGKPMANVKLYVLNEALNLLPIGSPGELYIGGSGIARGYLNKKKLTDSRFILNPFVSEKDLDASHTKLYKTGDLVSWLENGNLEYHGRNDFQVKIRGYRIELGEVEKAIEKCDAIQQALVIDREYQGRKYLAAYIVVDQNIDINIEHLREEILESIPDYMVPNSFTGIDSIPLTVNGKIDRSKLPSANFIQDQEYVPPSSELEEHLCAVWRECLVIEKIGIKDNFFLVGGDSILSLQVVSKANNRGIGLTTRMIFEYKTIEKLAKHVQIIEKEEPEQVQEGELLLSPSQFSFFSLYDELRREGESKGNKSGFNFTGLLKNSVVPDINAFTEVKLLSVEAPGNKEDILRFIQYIYQKHDILRLRYNRVKNDQWTANYVSSNDSLNVNKLVSFENLSQSPGVRSVEIQRIIDRKRAEFDIGQSPLLNFTYFNVDGDTSVFLCVILHQLISDPASQTILEEELEQFLNNSVPAGKTVNSFNRWINTYYEKTELEVKDPGQSRVESQFSEISFDKQKLRKINSKEVRSIEFNLDSNESKLLLGTCNSAFATKTIDLLCSSVFYCLSSLTTIKNTQVDIVHRSSGNEFDQYNFDRTLGSISYPYTLAVDLSEYTQNTNWSTLVGLVKESLSDAEARRNFSNSDVMICIETLTLKDGKNKGIESYKDFLFELNSTYQKTLYPQTLKIIFKCEYNQLKINLEYDRKSLPDKVVTRLSSDLQFALQDLIKYCELNSSPYYLRDIPEKTKLFALSNGDKHNLFESLIHYPSESASSPVFCVPPGGAGAESYFKLARKLARQSEVYICENIEVYTRNIYSLDSQVDYYCDLIRRASRGKPLRLLGASLGAILVHGIANELDKLGVVIEQIYLIDPIGYTMSEETAGVINKDKLVNEFNTEQKEQLNASLHQFYYSRNMTSYTGKGIIFQSNGLTSKLKDWNPVDRLIFENYDYFVGRHSEPELSYGLDQYFPDCLSVHLDGDHGQFLSKINLDRIAKSIYTPKK